MAAPQEGLPPVVAGVGLGVSLLAAIAVLVMDEAPSPPAPGKDIIGKPDRLRQFWEPQLGGRCGYYVTRNILKAYGMDVSIETLQQQSGEPIGDEWTHYEQYGVMFRANGIEVDAYASFPSAEAAVESLIRDLAAGKAILGRIHVGPLDSIWRDTPTWMGLYPGGHALWITGVRRTQNGIITHFICNDTAQRSRVDYPAAEFLQAWAFKAYSYIATRQPMPCWEEMP